MTGPARASEVVASARGLVKGYGATRVLDALDAEFRGGRLHAVTGPSGSGKTTFLHLLAGLELPQAGEIEVDGALLTALDRTERAARRRTSIAYVGQQAGLIGHLSALENVELALTLRGIDRSASRGVCSARIGRPRRADEPAGLAPLTRRARPGRDRPGGRLPAEAPARRRAHLATRRRKRAGSRSAARAPRPGHGCCGRVCDPRPARDRAGRRRAAPGLRRKHGATLEA